MISQAISDAYLNDEKDRFAVEQWLETEDFQTVCDLADICSSKMRDNFLHILNSKSAIARYVGRKLKDLIDKY